MSFSDVERYIWKSGDDDESVKNACFVSEG